MAIASESASPPSKTQKRKRAEALAEELEIDVNLPEPPSKKALRKAKKQKKETAVDEAQTDDGAIAEDSKSKGSKTTNGETASATKKPERSPHGIWIGNLPWTCDKAGLTKFFTDNSAGAITVESITRVHMPAPASVPKNWTQTIKPQNKGYAYVDFGSEQALYAARALTETPFGGRNVLIKDAKNFEGRPEEHTVAPKDKQEGKGMASEQKEPSDRIFVGNLGFETTKQELQEHFEQCGEVTNVFMATFEDTGKCKGFAWVTFADTSIAKAAVKGFVYRKADSDDEDQEEEAPKLDNAGEEEKAQPKKQRKRKIYINKMNGRSLRCEFAESSTERYNKRFRGAGRKTKEEGIDDTGTSGQAEANSSGVTSNLNGRGKWKHGQTQRTGLSAGASDPVGVQEAARLPEGRGTKIVFDE